MHEELARVEGLPVAAIRLALVLLIALVIAVAMKIVGVLLITSLLIIPAAAAQRHSRTPEQMAIGASVLGMLAVGGGPLVKIHFHTNEPWKVLEYCAGLGEIYDIVVEDMDRQARGLQG